MSISESPLYEINLKLDKIQAEVDRQGKQHDTQEEVLNKIYSSLTRIEDMIYYYTHNIKQPE